MTAQVKVRLAKGAVRTLVERIVEVMTVVHTLIVLGEVIKEQFILRCFL